MNEKEKGIVSLMVGIYCRSKHKTKEGLCDECKDLEKYSHKRLEHCSFKEEKPSCKKCPIHCYKAIYKTKIKAVMRFSGPRVIFYRPLEALKHFFER